MHKYITQKEKKTPYNICALLSLASFGILFWSSLALGEKTNNYTWDNWFSGPVKLTIGDNSQYTHLRFALESPRYIDGEYITPNERHSHARVAMYAKIDDKRWIRLATVIEKTPTWSGSVMNCYACQFKAATPMESLAPSGLDRLPQGVRISTPQSTLLLAYTERTFSPDPLGQRLAFAQFDEDSQSFVRSSLPGIDPQGANKSLFQSLGYMVDGNEVISAWRDPYLIQDKSGRLHVFFAARYNKLFFENNGLAASIGSFNPWSNAAIGHAVFDQQGHTWIVRPPLKLDRSPVQFELPQLIEHEGKYYLFQLQADWDSSDLTAITTEKNRKHALLVYMSDSLNGPWEPLSNGDAKLVNLDNIYGFTIRSLRQGQLMVAAFLENEVSMTSTAIIDMNTLRADILPVIKQFEAAETFQAQCPL